MSIYYSRQHMVLVLVAFLQVLAGTACSQSLQNDSDKMSWKTRVAEKSEPGQTLIVSGTVYKADGKTPASGILVDVYHTGADGLYAPRSEPRGTIRIRGQVRTNQKGQYQFTTIRPGSYPSGDAPAHIHYTLTGPGISGEQFLELLFEGDPKIPGATVRKERQRGTFSSIVAPREDADGVLHAEMNIKLSGGN